MALSQTENGKSRQFGGVQLVCQDVGTLRKLTPNPSISWVRQCHSFLTPFSRFFTLALPRGELVLGHQFGSAHPTGINVAFADGRSSMISYDVDLEVFNRMGDRRDGMPVE
jgi:prepilin-type processing-associated H-X9-DG protein